MKEKNKVQQFQTDRGLHNESALKDEETKIWPQILFILIGCTGSISLGLITSWSSPYAVQIANDKINYDISAAEAAYFSVLPPLGMMFSCIFFAQLTDIIGRKKTYLLMIIPQVVFWTATIVSNDIRVLWVARFIAGFGDGCYFVSFPIYVAEVSTPKVRGILGGAVTYCAFFGQFLVNVIGYYLNAKECAYACIGIPVVFFVLFVLAPESPYFCLMKGRDDEAMKSLRTLLGKKNVEKELLVLKSDVERQMSESGKWKEILTVRSNRNAFVAATILRMAQILSGMPVFVMSTQLLFETAGGSIDPRVSTMIFTGLCFFFYMINGFFVDKLGRRVAEISSLSLCAVSTFVESAYFYIDKKVDSMDLSSVRWIPLAGLLAYVVFSAIGVAIMPTLMSGELFSASIKSKAFILQVLLFGAAGSGVNYIFYFINSYTGLYGPFALFGTSSVVCAILSYFYIPETRGKTLEEIQQELKKR